MTGIAPAATNHLVELLSERAAQHPERLALRFVRDREPSGTDLSYGELHARACQVAAELSLRAKRGDRALLLSPSGPEYVLGLLGCFYAGIVAVPAYPPPARDSRQLERIASIARSATPALLLTEQALLPQLSAAQGAIEALRDVPLLALDALAANPAASFSPPAIRPDELAMLQYTSGSTAVPKGVMLTHANLMANEAAIHQAFSMQPDDVVVSWLPLFHDMGLIGTLLQPLYAGVTAVLMAPQRFMGRPRRWLEAISRYRGTVSGAPDFAYRLCAQRVDPAGDEPLDLSSWRLAFCGAEPIRDQTLQAFADKFAAAGFAREALYPCYGLAEATLIVTGGRCGGGATSGVFASRELRQNRALPAPGGQRLVSCGSPRPGHRLVIADPETGRPQPAGAIGEIRVAGPSIARGYWDDPEATRGTFVEEDGALYLRTGDLGFLHDGELYVTGREKDLIIVRGQNLYPQDIERAIEAENRVVRSGRVAAFSLEVAGEEGIAIAAEVNPRLMKLIDADGVCRELVELVARWFGEPPKLTLLLAAGEIPLTSSGKLQRGACRKLWLDGRLQVVAASGAGVP